MSAESVNEDFKNEVATPRTEYNSKPKITIPVLKIQNIKMIDLLKKMSEGVVIAGDK